MTAIKQQDPDRLLGILSVALVLIEDALNIKHGFGQTAISVKPPPFQKELG